MRASTCSRMVTTILTGVAGLLVLIFAGCSPQYINTLGGIAGSAGSGNISKLALKQTQKEAAYATIKAALDGAGVRGSSHFVRAVRAAVDAGDYGTACAAFNMGCEKSGLTPREVTNVLYGAAISIRLSSPDVSNGLVRFVKYINANY